MKYVCIKKCYFGKPPRLWSPGEIYSGGTCPPHFRPKAEVKVSDVAPKQVEDPTTFKGIQDEIAKEEEKQNKPKKKKVKSILD